MKRYKRLLAMFLAVGMVTTMLPDTAYAALAVTVPEQSEESVTAEEVGTEQIAESETEQSSTEVTDAATEQESSTEQETGKTEETEQQTEMVEEQNTEVQKPETEAAKQEDTESDEPKEVEVTAPASDQEEDATGNVILDYTLMEAGSSYKGNTDDNNTFVFKPEQSGFYYLYIESKYSVDVYAYHQYFYQSDETDEAVQSDFECYDSAYLRGQTYRIMYLDKDEVYKFQMSTDDEHTDFVITMSHPVQITDVKVHSNPTGYSYTSVNFSGTELAIDITDTVTSQNIEIISENCGSDSWLRLDVFRWFGIAHSGVWNDSRIYSDSVSNIDGKEELTSLDGLEDGTHTGDFALRLYNQSDSSQELIFPFTLQFVTEQNAVESLEVLEIAQDTYYKDWNQALGNFRVRVNYKDKNRTPIELDSYYDEVSAYLEYQDLDGNTYQTTSIENYLAGGGTLGEAVVKITYRKAETTAKITIAENPYDRIEVVEPSRSIYYANLSGDRGNWSSAGDTIYDYDIGKFKIYYKDADKEPLVYDMSEEGWLSGLSIGIKSESSDSGVNYRCIDDYLQSGGSCGEAVVTVSYRGMSTTYPITIEEKKIDHIVVAQSPEQTTYLRDADCALCLSGLVIKAYDGADEATANCTTYDYSECMQSDNEAYQYFYHAFGWKLGGHEEIQYLESGDYDVTVYLGTASTTFQIHVKDAVITDLKITAGENRSSSSDIWLYNTDKDYRFNSDDLMISFRDLDGELHAIESYSSEYREWSYEYQGSSDSLDYEVPDIDSPGTYPVTLKWLGAETTYNIQVVDKLIENMEILSMPSVTNAVVGIDDDISMYGLVLSVTELDGTVNKYKYHEWDSDGEYSDWNDISGSDYYSEDRSDVDWDTPGAYKIHISYKGVTCDIPVTVVENPVQSIELTSAPAVTEFYQCKARSLLDMQGVAYRIHYKNGEIAEGKLGDDEDEPYDAGDYVEYGGRTYWICGTSWKYVDGEDTALEYGTPTVGENAVIVSFMGVTTELPIIIKQDLVKSISCLKNPEKMEYLSDREEPDLYGAEFEIIYADDTKHTETITEHTNHVTVSDKYKDELEGVLHTSYRYDDEDGDYYSHLDRIYIYYMNMSTGIDLHTFDYASHSTGVVKEDEMFLIHQTKGESYSLSTFTASTTDQYYVSITGSPAGSIGIYQEDGTRIPYTDCSDGYDEENLYAATDWYSYHLEAGNTYYICNFHNDPDTESDKLLNISTTQKELIIDESNVQSFEVTEYSDNTWYDFESNRISAEYLSLFNMQYCITLTNGMQLDGSITRSGNVMEETPQLYGNPLTVRYKETYADEDDPDYHYVTQSDTNAIVLEYAGKTAEIPLHFNQPSPVSKLTVLNNPWQDKDIYTFNAGAMLIASPLKFKISYNDGREDKEVVFETEDSDDGSTSISIDNYVCTMAYKNSISTEGGENAVVLSYMGKTVEIPIHTQPNPVKSIAVVKNPDKMSYLPEFERVDLYGAQLRITYADGKTEIITADTHGNQYYVDNKYKQYISASRYNDTYISIQYIDQTTELTVSKASVCDQADRTLTAGMSDTVSLDQAATYQIYKFVPDETAVHTFSSTGGYDTYAYLYDDTGNEITYNDDGGENNNFAISNTLYAGSTYYYLVRMFSTGDTGDFQIHLTKNENITPAEKTKITEVNLSVPVPERGSRLADTDDINDSLRDQDVYGYSVYRSQWSPDDYRAMGGKAYRLMLVLKPDVSHEFDRTLTPMMNGQKVTAKSFSSTGSLTLYYTFPYTNCRVTLPEMNGYTIRTDADMEENSVQIPYKGSISFSYEKNADHTTSEKLIVKAGNKVITPVNGTYTLENITSDLDVMVKTEELTPDADQVKISLYNKGSLYDILTTDKGSCVADNDPEDQLPVLDSYPDGSDQFFFGWYQDKDAKNNGTGIRFKSTTHVNNQDKDVYAKWGKGIFSFLYRGLYANYKILSIDEDNRVKVQLGDGKNKAIATGLQSSGVEATGADESSDRLVVPDTLDLSNAEELAEIGIDLGSADVVAVGAGAFADEKGITSVILPDTIEAIGADAFKGCSNLTSVALPASVDKVESGTFEGCTSLSSVVIPDGVTTIEENAFSGCSSLTTVVLPDTIESLDATAFAAAGSDENKLTVVCSSELASNDAVVEAVSQAGATIEKVDISFEEGNVDELDFNCGDGAYTLTPVVQVNGEVNTDRVIELTKSADCDKYYDVTAEEGNRKIVITPKAATEEKQSVTLTVSGVSKVIALHTEALSLLEKRLDGAARYVIDKIPDAVYTGKAIRPEHLTVTDRETGAALKEGTDYEVSYYGNVNAGTADVYIDGIGNYTDSLYGSFIIRKAESAIQVSDLSIQLGTTGNKLGAVISGGGTPVYTSSNTGVVTIQQDGTLTPKKAGTSVITITVPATDNYNGAEKKITVTVKSANTPEVKPQPKPDEKPKPEVKAVITVTKTTIDKVYGDKAFALSASVNTGSLTYASSNSKIVTVDTKGIVSIKAAGTAKITIKAVDASKKVLAEKTVTVKVKKAAAKLKMKKTSYNVVYGAKAFSLGVTSNAGVKYTTGNKKIVTVSSKGKVTIKGCGKVTITVATTNANYSTSKKNITIQVVPKTAKLSSLKNSKSKQLVVSWSKQKEAVGYVVEYSTDKKFKKGVKSVDMKKSATTKTTIRKLQKGKTYYVRVKAYTKSGSEKLYGKVSNVKSQKIKK